MVDILVSIGGQPKNILHAESDKLWLHSVDAVTMGRAVEQHQPVGNLDLIFQAFHEQWRQRWCRHNLVAFSRWDALIELGRHVLPYLSLGTS